MFLPEIDCPFCTGNRFHNFALPSYDTLVCSACGKAFRVKNTDGYVVIIFDSIMGSTVALEGEN